eukprot:588932-Rhodomonas_salina.4
MMRKQRVRPSMEASVVMSSIHTSAASACTKVLTTHHDCQHAAIGTPASSAPCARQASLMRPPVEPWMSTLKLRSSTPQITPK